MHQFGKQVQVVQHTLNWLGR